MLKKIKTYSNFIKFLFIKLLYIIIIPIIIYDIILIAQSIVKPNVAPSIFGIKTFTIISSSMEPTFKIDDIIFVKKIDENQLQIGDIISFIQDKDIITHRIEKIEKNEGGLVFITKGDANSTTDINKVKLSQIEGKYIFKISKVGKIFYILKNKVVFIIVTIILLICYIIEKNTRQQKIEADKNYLLLFFNNILFFVSTFCRLNIIFYFKTREFIKFIII